MISGLLVTHQCEEFDYCYKVSIESMLHCCDEVIVVDAGSTDGTRDFLADYGGRVKVFDSEWKPVPGTNGQWLGDLYNLAKSKSSQPFQLGIQADEVIHELDLQQITKLQHNTSFKRLNFWKDPHHMLPEGVACGSRVFRFAGSEVSFIGDAECMDTTIWRNESDMCIFHYGFLRKTEAVIAKSIATEDGVFGFHNPVFEKMKDEGRKPYDEYYGPLVPYNGPHPRFVQHWLAERGYNTGYYIAAQHISQFIKPDWTGVEIGIFMGDSSRHLLSKSKFMYLIDPCMSYAGNPDAGVYSPEEMILNLVREYPGRTEFIKGMAHLVSGQIPMVDFAYIDGNHTFEYVTLDIQHFWPKIRSGGFLSGHDYALPGVKNSVKNLSRATRLPIEVHGDSWLIRKP